MKTKSTENNSAKDISTENKCPLIPLLDRVVVVPAIRKGILSSAANVEYSVREYESHGEVVASAVKEIKVGSIVYFPKYAHEEIILEESGTTVTYFILKYGDLTAMVK
jgi:co-chaperonin GroES (HSP10)